MRGLFGCGDNRRQHGHRYYCPISRRAMRHAGAGPELSRCTSLKLKCGVSAAPPASASITALPIASSGWLTVVRGGQAVRPAGVSRSEEHTSELQSLMRISYAVFCLKKKNKKSADE